MTSSQKEVLDLRVSYEEEIRQLRHENKLLRHKLYFFNDLCISLSNSIDLIFDSKSWKIGSIIINLIRKITGKNKEELSKVISKELQLCLEQSSVEIIKKNKVKEEKVDIIISVFNAKDDVENCINSIFRNTLEDKFRLLIIDDCSDYEVSQWLKNKIKEYSNVELIYNSENLGYTKSINKGLKKVNQKKVVILNSDVVVTPKWLELMLECMDITKAACVGPLSNAASWQSTPELFDQNNDWIINDIPHGFSIDEFSEFVYILSEERFPSVPILNGFCVLYDKKVFDDIGLFDENLFPTGYGEENDFFIRAKSKGYSFRVDDRLFIFHAKSKSFNHERRKVLSENGNKALVKKYGVEVLDKNNELMKVNKILNEIRTRHLLYEVQYNKVIEGKYPKVTFLLTAGANGGGTHSVIQEAYGMKELGVDVKVIILEKYKVDFLRSYDQIINTKVIEICNSEVGILKSGRVDNGVVVATMYTTVPLVKQIKLSHPQVQIAYYIQDYEPYFFEQNSVQYKLAYNSYELMKNELMFAKTNWLCNEVYEKHSARMVKIKPSLDQSIYSSQVSFVPEVPFVISAMIRPSTKRRSPVETYQVLKWLKEKYKDKVCIEIFGCEDSELSSLKQDNGKFSCFNHGVIKREKVSDILKRSYVFLDLSTYQAFGRTGLEAMASATVTFLPTQGGVHEYAVDETNCFLVDVKDIDNIKSKLINIMEDTHLGKKIIIEAKKTSENYDILSAVLSELSIFRNWMKINA